MTVGRLHIQIVRHTAELQIQVDQQHAGMLAQLLGQVAGHQGRPGASLGIHHRQQLAVATAAGTLFLHHAQQRSGQLLRVERFGEKIPRPGLHGQAQALGLVQRTTHQQGRALSRRALHQSRQLLAPHGADPQQQQIGHLLKAVQRIAVAIADQSGSDLQAMHMLADVLQILERLGIATADQQFQALAR
ncbi:hypothetical protein D3C78_697220 [compost metagenome]